MIEHSFDQVFLVRPFFARSLVRGIYADYELIFTRLHHFGNIKLKRLKAPLVSSQVASVKPDLCEIIDPEEAQPHTFSRVRRKGKTLAEPGNAVVILQASEPPVIRNYHLFPMVTIRQVIDAILGRLSMLNVAP
jgi:hypothetical protein